MIKPNILRDIRVFTSEKELHIYTDQFNLFLKLDRDSLYKLYEKLESPKHEKDMNAFLDEEEERILTGWSFSVKNYWAVKNSLCKSYTDPLYICSMDLLKNDYEHMDDRGVYYMGGTGGSFVISLSKNSKDTPFTILKCALEDMPFREISIYVDNIIPQDSYISTFAAGLFFPLGSAKLIGSY